MKHIMILGAMLALTSLRDPALAQTPQSPNAATATMQARTRPASDELITLLQTKGILTETEAALVSQSQLVPETKQVLAEVLLSKHLISREEYDRTLQSCSTSAVPATAASQPATSSTLGSKGSAEPGAFKSFSDRIASILPGGGQTTDLDFGVIQPSPRWTSADQAALDRAKAKHKSHKHHKQDDSQTN